MIAVVRTPYVIVGTVVCAAALSFAAPSMAKAQGAAKDTIVEVIGLDVWTLARLQSALESLRPGISLSDAACAVLLRDSIGFAEAAVETWSFPDTVWTTLTVVEPHRSDRIRPRALSDSFPDRSRWASVIELARKNPQVVHPLQQYEFFRGDTDTFFGRVAEPAALEFRDLLAELAMDADFDELTWTVLHDKNPYNRLIAAVLLGHHPQHEEAWWTLMRALRGPSDFAGGMARAVLEGMARQEEHRVDWTSAQEDLRYLLSGTNLFAFLPVLNVLRHTRLDPSLASELIPHGRDLIIGNLLSKNPARRKQVTLFLSTVTDKDFGDDQAAWLAWLESLPSPNGIK